ncbi:MAG: hypothetical protein ACM3O4_02700 [Ignavibacteriales bacterium]
MDKNGITPRESLDIHEIMMFKVLCGIKASTLKSLVKDEDLKNILEKDYENTKESLKELKNLIKTSSLLDQ